jgi:hypothetical protein
MNKISKTMFMVLCSISILANGCGGCGGIQGGDGDGESDGDRDQTGDGTNTDGTGDGLTDGAGDDSNICADVTLTTRRVTPTVMLLVDQSGSMDEDFGSSGSRWDVLRDSLLDVPDGLIYDLQSVVEFGLALYSARSESECPLMTTVPPAIDNYDAIEAVYGPADTISDTPTGDAIDVVVDMLESAPDPEGDPAIIVLCTDGEPDRCEELNPQHGQEEAVAAAENAYDAGYRTYIISVGEGMISATHLQDMADAGVGASDAPYWEVGDDDGLRDALRTIVGGELSCLIEVNGEIVMDLVCSGRVTLNGVDLPCEDPNGWHAPDSKHIELLGDACDTLLNTTDPTLSAVFPCDAVIMI